MLLSKTITVERPLLYTRSMRPAVSYTHLGLIILLNLITPWDLMMIVPIVSLLFPLLAAVSQRRLEAYRHGMKGFYAKALMSSQTQCALFAAAGFLGQALNTSGDVYKSPI